MKSFKRTRTVVQTSATALVVAALVFAGTQLLLGTNSGALVSGTNFTITSPSPGPVLYPQTATPSNLPLTFSNPLTQPIRVYTLTVSFTNSFPSGCPSSELTLNGTAVSMLPSPISAPGVTFSFTGSQFAVPKAVGATPGTAVDNLTVALPNINTNQDACKGLSLALAYRASAYYTDATTSVLGSSPNPSNAGQAVTLTDTVTSATDNNVPVGGVLFYSCTSTTVASCSSTALGAAVALNASGVATTTTTPATGGTYYYEAIYTPTDSTNFSASTTNIITQTVNSTSGSTVFLWSSANPASVGDSVTYVADVLGLFPPGPPFSVGTMTLKDNGAALPSCVNVPVLFGLATCTVTYQTTLNSPHLIVATYSGDAHHGTGTSNTVNETVKKATPTNKVTNSPTTLGATLKFSATVSGAGIAPTGAVTWNVSGSAGATTCGSTTVLSGGVATCTIIATKAGSYSVSDNYGGDGNYNSAGSNTDGVSVARATPTNVMTNSAPPALGGTLKFTTTVTGVSGITPTGSVNWKVSGSAGATSCGATTVLTSGVATCTITATKGGTYVVSDTYNGDPNYTTATSNTDTVSVAKATPTDTLKSSLNPTTVGSAVTYTATLTGFGVTPSGTVTFVDGGSAINSCGSHGVVNLVGGVAICTVTYSSTSGSPRQITAPYAGDANYNSANSNTVSETLNRATPTNKVTNSASTTVGAKITFTATVSGPGVTPTGSVTWSVSTPTGVTSCASTATLSNGAATCTITATKVGTYSVSNSYAGDANYTSLASNTDTVTVSAAKNDHLSVSGGTRS